MKKFTFYLDETNEMWAWSDKPLKLSKIIVGSGVNYATEEGVVWASHFMDLNLTK